MGISAAFIIPCKQVAARYNEFAPEIERHGLPCDDLVLMLLQRGGFTLPICDRPAWYSSRGPAAAPASIPDATVCLATPAGFSVFFAADSVAITHFTRIGQFLGEPALNNAITTSVIYLALRLGLGRVFITTDHSRVFHSVINGEGPLDTAAAPRMLPYSTSNNDELNTDHDILIELKLPEQSI